MSGRNTHPIHNLVANVRCKDVYWVIPFCLNVEQDRTFDPNQRMIIPRLFPLKSIDLHRFWRFTFPRSASFYRRTHCSWQIYTREITVSPQIWSNFTTLKIIISSHSELAQGVVLGAVGVASAGTRLLSTGFGTPLPAYVWNPSMVPSVIFSSKIYYIKLIFRSRFSELLK